VRLVALADPSPIHRPVDEDVAEDHADVVELKALRRVDAADLVDPLLRIRPEVRLRIPGRSFRASDLAFQGIDQSPTLTSGTSSPTSSGSDWFASRAFTASAMDCSLMPLWRCKRAPRLDLGGPFGVDYSQRAVAVCR
jgi:hypothetical protein